MLNKDTLNYNYNKFMTTSWLLFRVNKKQGKQKLNNFFLFIKGIPTEKTKCLVKKVISYQNSKTATTLKFKTPHGKAFFSTSLFQHYKQLWKKDLTKVNKDLATATTLTSKNLCTHHFWYGVLVMLASQFNFHFRLLCSWLLQENCRRIPWFFAYPNQVDFRFSFNS